jgi:hypothetical protein
VEAANTAAATAAAARLATWLAGCCASRGSVLLPLPVLLLAAMVFLLLLPTRLPLPAHRNWPKVGVFKIMYLLWRCLPPARGRNCGSLLLLCNSICMQKTRASSNTSAEQLFRNF